MSYPTEEEAAAGIWWQQKQGPRGILHTSSELRRAFQAGYEAGKRMYHEVRGESTVEMQDRLELAELRERVRPANEAPPWRDVPPPESDEDVRERGRGKRVTRLRAENDG